MRPLALPPRERAAFAAHDVRHLLEVAQGLVDDLPPGCAPEVLDAAAKLSAVLAAAVALNAVPLGYLQDADPHGGEA